MPSRFASSTDSAGSIVIKKKEKHIDDAQPATVDEHFQLILDDRSTIDHKFAKVTPNDLPYWFDASSFKIGQQYYMDNLFSFASAHLAGLIAILAVPHILEVLVYTKRTNTICLSYRRFAETILLMFGLFREDMLNPDSKWFKSMNAIRWKHANVSKKRVQEGMNAIYQKDMAITEFGFIGYAFICPEKVGLAHGTEEQKKGFNHFWRVTGHLLGIDDRINVCRKDVNETTELCRRIASEIVAKYMRVPEKDFRQITSNTLQGLWYADFTINEDAFMNHTYYMTGLEYHKPIGWYSYFNLKRLEWTLSICSVPYIGAVVRTMLNCVLMLSYWLLENYPIGPWLAFGKKNSRLCLYPNI